MEAIVLFTFLATGVDELSVRKGSIVKVLNPDEDGHWFNAVQGGRDGLIPKNNIQMKAHEWYKGNITQQNAEDTLSQQFDGAFLISENEGDIVLSVKFGTGVQHFPVLQDGAGKYFLQIYYKFNSLNQLVNFHRTSSVSRTQTIYLKDMHQENEMIVEALFDFVAQEEVELSFLKGQHIEVIDRSDQNWWKGRLNGKEGMFPASYVKSINQ
ncbi:growth factor receptor-bound protein 2-like [Antedon mediterranea]|uniref:growth factor receptor-bound protein 2-like n=1 Tax=Antedon mediterranea TaxID=105859 RepID=UPI003AF710E0